MSRPRPMTEFSKKLRNSQTDAEKHLWSYLRKSALGVKFRRQFAIGPYIVDFCCLKNRLVIELDGGQHQQNVQRDVVRDQFLTKRGYLILRFWNDEALKNTEIVLAKIYHSLSPLPASPGESGGGVVPSGIDKFEMTAGIKKQHEILRSP